MVTLGEELLLIALDASNGVLLRSHLLLRGLTAAGLADLSALGLITLWSSADGRSAITRTERPAGHPPLDPLLEAAWTQVSAPARGDLTPEDHIWHATEPSLDDHLDSLRARGILDWGTRWPPNQRYGRFRLHAPEAAAAARARLDRVRTRAGAGPPDLDLAGIVRGLGLARMAYRGVTGRSRRAALAAATEDQRFLTYLAPSVRFTFRRTLPFDSTLDKKMTADMWQALGPDRVRPHRGGGAGTGGSAG